MSLAPSLVACIDLVKRKFMAKFIKVKIWKFLPGKPIDLQYDSNLDSVSYYMCFFYLWNYCPCSQVHPSSAH